MRKLVPESDRSLIDQLVAEEQRHFTLLSELEKQLLG
jgi:rubrerythrin